MASTVSSSAVAYERLVRASGDGRVDSVKALLQQGVSPDGVDKEVRLELKTATLSTHVSDIYVVDCSWKGSNK